MTVAWFTEENWFFRHRVGRRAEVEPLADTGGGNGDTETALRRHSRSIRTRRRARRRLVSPPPDRCPPDPDYVGLDNHIITG